MLGKVAGTGVEVRLVTMSLAYAASQIVKHQDLQGAARIGAGVDDLATLWTRCQIGCVVLLLPKRAITLGSSLGDLIEPAEYLNDQP